MAAVNFKVDTRQFRRWLDQHQNKRIPGAVAGALNEVAFKSKSQFDRIISRRLQNKSAIRGAVRVAKARPPRKLVAYLLQRKPFANAAGGGKRAGKPERLKRKLLKSARRPRPFEWEGEVYVRRGRARLPIARLYDKRQKRITGEFAPLRKIARRNVGKLKQLIEARLRGGR